MSDGGKGSAPRPIEVPKDEFNRRWEETFGKQKQGPTLIGETTALWGGPLKLNFFKPVEQGAH